MKHEQLVNAAKELNEVLLPDPEINVHATPPVLKKQVIEYAGILAPGDNLTENTVSVLKELGITIPGINVINVIEEEPTTSPEPEDAQEVSLEEFVMESNDFKELKDLVKEYDEFKPLRGIISKFKTVPALKQVMLKELGVEDIQQTEDVPDAEKEEKPAPKTPDKKNKTSKAKKEKGELSNKAIVYLEWKKGEKNPDTLLKLVTDQVKRTTIKSWIGMWGREKGLPAIAKKQ